MAYGSEHGQEPDHDHTPQANESASVAPEDRAHCWTLDGVVINQVQEYKYLGIWFQEDGGWDHHADKALNKMRSAYGYWRPLLACAVSRLECACSCYRPLFTQRSRTEQRSGTVHRCASECRW
jgi:hypothetical protein